MTKKLKIIFTLSLLLNILLAGLSLGSLYPKKYSRFDSVELSVEGRKILDKSKNESRSEMHANMKSMKQKRKTLAKVMTAPSFNEQAYREVMNDILDSKDEMGRKRAVSMGKAMSKLSLEDRKQLSKKMIERFSKMGRKGHKNREHKAGFHE